MDNRNNKTYEECVGDEDYLREDEKEFLNLVDIQKLNTFGYIAEGKVSYGEFSTLLEKHLKEDDDLLNCALDFFTLGMMYGRTIKE